MEYIDIIAIAAVVLIIGGAVFYIVREKKRGRKCIGCPYAGQCGGKCDDEGASPVADQEK